MAHEFDFLRSRWPRLAALGNDAARIMEASPSVSVRTLNRFCEMAAIMAMEQLKITSIPDDTQEDRLDALKTSGAPSEILAKFHNVLLAAQTQSPLGRVDTAAACVQDCQDIARWLMRQADGGIYVQQAQSAEPAHRARPVVTEEEPASSYVPNRVEMYPQENNVNIRRGRNLDEARPVAGSQTDTADHRGFSRESVANLLGGGFGRVNWVIVAAIALVVVIIIILLVLLGKNDPGKTTLPTATPTPPGYTVPVATLVPTPTPTPDPATFIVYADDLEPEAAPSDFDTWYSGRWGANDHPESFRIGDTWYDHGVGMFIKSRQITSAHKSVSLLYDLDGQYSQMIFDLGADPDWSYDPDPEVMGTFRIIITADDSQDALYDSQSNPGDFIDRNVTVDVTGVNSIRIKLMQSKGDRGTLSVVLGDLRFILTEDAWAAQNAPAATETPAPTETPAATETPAP